MMTKLFLFRKAGYQSIDEEDPKAIGKNPLCCDKYRLPTKLWIMMLLTALFISQTEK